MPGTASATLPGQAGTETAGPLAQRACEGVKRRERDVESRVALDGQRRAAFFGGVERWNVDLHTVKRRAPGGTLRGDTGMAEEDHGRGTRPGLTDGLGHA